MCDTFWHRYLVVAINLFLIFETKSIGSSQRFQSLYVYFGWGFPVVLTLIPLFFKKIGKVDGVRCWIVSDYLIWEFFCFYLFMGFAALVGVILWIRICYRVWRISKEEDHSIYENSFPLIRHIFYVIFFSLVFSAIFSNRLYQLVNDQKENFVLRIFQILGLSGHGIMIFFVFGLTLKNLQLWRDGIRHFFNLIWCFPKKSIQDPERNSLTTEQFQNYHIYEERSWDDKSIQKQFKM